MFVSRVISRPEPEAEKTREWMKNLREKIPPKVYDIDPYVEVFCLRDGVFSLFAESADGMGDTWHHLIVGPELALLIDTGFGIGNLKALVNFLTGNMPLLVTVTHEHLDHSYGCFQFDRVYCHEFAVPILKSQMNPHIWDNLYDEDGNGKWLRFNKRDIIPFKEYEIISCPNNFVFDLGRGHTVEMVHTPGHAPGGVSFIDRLNRILFTGAMHSNYVTVGCNPNKRARIPYSEYNSVTAFLAELKKLEKRLSEFDRVFPAHEILDLDNIIVPDMVKVCEAVIADPDSQDFYTENKFGVKVKHKALGAGSIRYIDQSIT